MRVMREKFLYKKLRACALNFLLIICLAGFVLAFSPRVSYAGCACTGCVPGDCDLAAVFIKAAHAIGRAEMKAHTTAEFNKHRGWMTSTFFVGQILPAMMRMTEQLSAVAMQQVMAIGMFMDAKHQMETQRLLQELQNQAHKDYQPSEDFCWFGTNVRSIAASEQIGRYNTLALNSRQMSRHLGKANTSGADARDRDKLSRWRHFAEFYCDPQDNNWDKAAVGSGLTLACGAGGGDTDRINIDIDFTRLIDEKRTLDVAFTDKNKPTSDEEDVLALGNNLYGHDVLVRSLNPSFLGKKQYQHLYMALRSVAAKRSVAENSYNAIVGMKSAGTSDAENNGGPNTGEFLGAILKELGVPDGEIYQLIGEQPSYYAQLEILAKKIYQNPDFYSNLYDKPANVKRKSVALKAIELMLDRAIFESQLRQEMAMSVLLSSRLRPNFRDVNKELSGSGG